MNVNIYYTKVYKNESAFRRGKNKPNSNPIKPNSNPISEMAKMNVNIYYTKVYNNETAFRRKKNKPNQSQFQTQFQTRRRFFCLLYKRSPGADKIALKIYPFGIDYPIVLKEMLFTTYGKDYD